MRVCKDRLLSFSDMHSQSMWQCYAITRLIPRKRFGFAVCVMNLSLHYNIIDISKNFVWIYVQNYKLHFAINFQPYFHRCNYYLPSRESQRILSRPQWIFQRMNCFYAPLEAAEFQWDPLSLKSILLSAHLFTEEPMSVFSRNENVRGLHQLSNKGSNFQISFPCYTNL